MSDTDVAEILKLPAEERRWDYTVRSISVEPRPRLANRLVI